ncbi:meiosis-specific nuclear structural protein 1 isoform X2 [Arapaima gigas]
MKSVSQRGGITHSQQQKMLAKSQREDEWREDQIKDIMKENHMHASLLTEDKVERKRYLRKVQEEQRERQIDEALLKAEHERIMKKKHLEQDDKIAREMACIKYEKLRDEKLRQQIRKNSIELRDLEAKIKLAYLNRERAVQIAEKDAIRYNTIRQEAEMAQIMKSHQEQALMEEKKEEQRRYEEVVRYQQELEQQLEEKEHKRQEAYEKFLKEKLMVDEIVQKIYEEDQMEQQLKLDKIKATQRCIEEFKKQQAEWRQMEQKKMEVENQRILEYAKYQQRREEDWMAKVKERKDAKHQIQRMLAERIEIETQQREEMDRVREELNMEEQEEHARQKQIEEMERRIRRRLELQHTCQEQMAIKEMHKQAEQEEEEKLQQMMRAKFAEDDRIEQINIRKQHMKQLEHRRDVEKFLEDRQQQLLANKEREAEERAIEQQREAARLQIIEEERQKLLKHHASKLLGYLPKGIFREEDLDHFDEEFKKNFQKQKDHFSEEDLGEE